MLNFSVFTGKVILSAALSDQLKHLMCCVVLQSLKFQSLF